MTFDKHFRAVACGALVVGLGATAAAQNGTNWRVLSNGLDAVYAGLGAGGTQTTADGIGAWVDGNDLRGNHVTGLGVPGYRQVAFFTSECVLGAPPAVSLNFPAITFTEFDGRNNNAQDIWVRPDCAVGGAPTGVTTGGVLPYGLSPGASANFLLTALPTGAGLPSSTVQLLPNNGLVPSSNGGTATLIAAAAASLPIASTGFCWAVRFTWTPTALQSLDHVDGWWFWQTNSANGNQYWAMSNDELNMFQSNTVALDGGATGLVAFFSSTEYDTYDLTRDPSLNHAVAPVGFNGAGVYYATTSYGVINPAFNPNGGGDLGRHGGTALGSGTPVGGVINPNTGLGTQDPAGSPTAGLLPTFGFQSWGNESLPGQFLARTVWAQVDWGGVLGIAPEGLPSVPVGPPGTRLGISVVNPPGPGPWPQGVTNTLRTIFTHTVSPKPDPDPLGFPAGSFGVGNNWAATAQLNLATLSPVCGGGVPVAVDFCSTDALAIFDPATARISHSGSITVGD